MSTRGSIHFVEGNTVVFDIYKQHDTYVSGLGADLVRLLKKISTNPNTPCWGYSEKPVFSEVFRFIQAISYHDDYHDHDCNFCQHKTKSPEALAKKIFKNTDQEYVYVIQYEGVNKKIFVFNKWEKKLCLFQGNFDEFEEFVSNAIQN